MNAEKTPYFAVIFSAKRRDEDEGYGEMAALMEAQAKTMPGYLGFESARNADGFGIAVSYWENEENIANWKRQIDHLEAQKRGQEVWYENYDVRVARVERAYSMNKKSGDE